MDGYTEEVVRYHLLLLAQAGLVDFEPELTSTGRIIGAHVLGLNWAGHEFLDAVRSEGVWRKLLAYAKDKGGSCRLIFSKRWRRNCSRKASSSPLTAIPCRSQTARLQTCRPS
ncbi:MAG: DUF2513 domain-containing protein [Betaproteobacteria bacterium]|uniref:DUF2513 domain-containing protein n=1 Tax=Candidatus Proximibacter danicus TaxID=2954365 RepID=A0A9D7PQX8_9PROT|nr:DUF2513 domain-containing protein [Candidatus Proximibacter danicus]